ncbi:MAG: hypothetical protein ACK54F_03525 [Planctomycetia bacterium]
MINLQKSPALVTPTINMNGTDARDLMDALDNAMLSLHDASKALSKCSPHGRDYHMQGPDAIAIAIRQHISRMQRLADISTELMTISLAVADQR